MRTGRVIVSLWAGVVTVSSHRWVASAKCQRGSSAPGAPRHVPTNRPRATAARPANEVTRRGKRASYARQLGGSSRFMIAAIGEQGAAQGLDSLQSSLPTRSLTRVMIASGWAPDELPSARETTPSQNPTGSFTDFRAGSPRGARARRRASHGPARCRSPCVRRSSPDVRGC